MHLKRRSQQILDKMQIVSIDIDDVDAAAMSDSSGDEDNNAQILGRKIQSNLSAETFLTFKSRLKLNCSRPVTTPDFPASSQHRAADSLAIDTGALYKCILHYIRS